MSYKSQYTGPEIDALLSKIRPYEVYTALITQIDTAAPTAIILENTLGVVPTWRRISQGVYEITNTSSFCPDLDKCAVFLEHKVPYSFSAEVRRLFNNSNNLEIQTRQEDSQAGWIDSALYHVSFEIRIYP